MKKARSHLAPDEAALELSEILPKPHALIGALAVAAYGFVRATNDVDFASPVAARAIQERLAEAGVPSTVRRDDAFEGNIQTCVTGTLGGVRFDVIHPPVPIDWDRLVLLPLRKTSKLGVVDLDALLRLKLRAGGPQDVIDVVHLLRLNPERVPRAQEIAESYGLRERLDAWLHDPRLRSPDPTPRRRR